MKAHCRLALIVLLALSAVAYAEDKSPSSKMPALLPWSQQIAVREAWLQKRHAMLLPVMRKHGVGMWIIVNEEFHNDPLTEYVAPPRVYTGNRDIFVFVDAGEKGLKKYAITGYADETLKPFFETWDEPRPPQVMLKALFDWFLPKTIALSTTGPRGVTRSLTHESFLFLSDSLGPEATPCFVPAAELIEDYLSTRLPEEFDTYQSMVEATEILTRRALSNEVIHPGTTTVGDIRRWLYDQLWENRFITWFQPDVRVQRRGLTSNMSRGFLGVVPESLVIQPGDLVHIDFGLSYMGLSTDWQKMAYVLKPGEREVPAGLRTALANTNALQDAVTQTARPGKTAGEVYQTVMAQMQKMGIVAKIYSHPIGAQGHGLGPSIDYRSAEGGVAEAGQPLVKDTYLSVELNSETPVSEWDGQKVFVTMEDDAYLTDEGYKFFRPRQTSFYLVH